MTAWQDASSGAVYWMRRAWDWLHTLVRPDETMLARLRSARRIKLHHPAAQSEVDVLARWRNYLTRQRWRHFFWLGVNALITPFATALFVLPGPNLIGIWFAYRTVHHGIVVWGITRVQRNLIPIELHALKSLDRTGRARRRRQCAACCARKAPKRSSTRTWRGGAARSSEFRELHTAQQPNDRGAGTRP